MNFNSEVSELYSLSRNFTRELGGGGSLLKIMQLCWRMLESGMLTMIDHIIFVAERLTMN